MFLWRYLFSARSSLSQYMPVRYLLKLGGQSISAVVWCAGEDGLQAPWTSFHRCFHHQLRCESQNRHPGVTERNLGGCRQCRQLVKSGFSSWPFWFVSRDLSLWTGDLPTRTPIATVEKVGRFVDLLQVWVKNTWQNIDIAASGRMDALTEEGIGSKKPTNCANFANPTLGHLHHEALDDPMKWHILIRHLLARIHSTRRW